MRLAALLSALLALPVGAAHAAPASSAECPAPYTLDALLAHLVAVEAGLRGDDPASAHAAATALEAGLPCLAELLPPLVAGRAYRAVGAGWAVSDAPDAVDRASAWFRTAAELEPTFDYGLQDLPADHPVRDVYHAARASADVPDVAVEGRAFASPADHFLDGRRLDAPRARPDRPHLLQRQDAAVTSWLVDGAAFPDDVLAKRVAAAPKPAVDEAAARDAADAEAKAQAKAQAAAAKAEAAAAKAAAREAARAEKEEAKALARAEKEAARERTATAPPPEVPAAPADPPKGPPRDEVVAAAEPPPTAKVRASASSDGVVVLKRQRPPEKTPLLIGGSVVAILGGGLYALALDAHADFGAATHEDDVLRHARQANRLVLASAAALAVGAGAFTWGVMLDGGTPLPTLRLRF